MKPCLLFLIFQFQDIFCVVKKWQTLFVPDKNKKHEVTIILEFHLYKLISFCLDLTSLFLSDCFPVTLTWTFSLVTCFVNGRLLLSSASSKHQTGWRKLEGCFHNSHRGCKIAWNFNKGSTRRYCTFNFETIQQALNPPYSLGHSLGLWGWIIQNVLTGWQLTVWK